MNLVRKIKISKLVDNLTETEKEIVNFINSWITDLIPFKMDDKPQSIYYMTSEGLYVLEQIDRTDRLWCRYPDFCSVLIVKYSMEYGDIKILMKYLIEEAFKQKVSTPIFHNNKNIIWIEEAFKQTISR